VALELLARHAERVERDDDRLEIASVCLLNGGLFPETHRPTRTQRLLKSPLGFVVARLMTERRFAASFASVFGPETQPSATVLADSWRLVAFNDGARIAHRLIRYIDERRRHRKRWVGALRTAVPLRVVCGAADPVSGAHMTARLRRELPGADVIDLLGIGHYPQLEAPYAVLGAYLGFRGR
jgi:pimeloyl-ACP methyl ester carboxylesterase